MEAYLCEELTPEVRLNQTLTRGELMVQQAYASLGEDPTLEELDEISALHKYHVLNPLFDHYKGATKTARLE